MTFIPPPLPPGTEPKFQVYWQQVLENLAVTINDQQNSVEDIEAALNAAGIALDAANQRMPMPPALSIAVPAGLPVSQQFRRYDGGDDVTLNTEWSMTVFSGTITATMAAATGILTVTALGSNAVINIVSIRDNIALSNLYGVSIAPAGGMLTDGDKGDITVTAAGATFTIDADVVTYGKLQNVAASRLLGRATASVGDAEEITLGTNLSFAGTTLNATGGGSTPTGTGFTHITAGAQDAAAKLVDTADINDGQVTLAKQANMATASVVYRKTAGAGAPEVQTLATLKTDLGLTGTNSGDQTSIVGITGSLAEFNTALTGADFTTGGGTATGSNTGDQTTIVGITGTKAQFDTAVSDGNILYVGDVTQYTDELAQDAVGAMVDGSLTYVDATPLLQRAALTGAVTAPAGSNATSLGSFTSAQLNAAISDGDFQPLDTQLTDIAGLVYTANAGKVITVNAGASAFELQTPTAPPAAPPTFTTVEVDLGSPAKRSGKFTITGAGMTIGKPVFIQQAVGPYTGKGTLADEAEMEQMTVTASVTSATVITAYFDSQYRVAGNFKFNYLIGA